MEVGTIVSQVTWNEPFADDASDNITLLIKTHSPGGLFGVGDTSVMYMYTDSSNNIATCNFVVTIAMGECKLLP